MKIVELLFRFLFIVAGAILILQIVRNPKGTSRVLNSITGLVHSGFQDELAAGSRRVKKSHG